MDLQPAQVHIWWTPLQDPGPMSRPDLLERYRACLPVEELAEAAGSQQQGLEARRVAARALTRLVLARCCCSVGGRGDVLGQLPAGPQELRFVRGAHGKPHLLPQRAGQLPVRHNLTHTQDIAGVAVALGAASDCRQRAGGGGAGPAAAAAASRVLGVGLDVERLDRAPRDPLGLARRRMAPQELALLQAAPDAASRARLFMCLWVLKEAFVKARGTGISAPPGLRGFAIGLEQATPQHAAAIQLAVPRARPAPGGLLAIRLSMHGQGGSGGGAEEQPPPPMPASAPPTVPPPPAAISSAVALDEPHASSCSYSFLLFQPTPDHVAALCLAQAAPASPLELGGAQPPAGLGLPLAAPLPGELVQWWCVPLEAEGRMDEQVVVLASS